MESIPPYTKSKIFFGNSKTVSSFGHGLVKGGVEAGELRYTGINLFRVANQFQSSRNMQRGKMHSFLQRRQHMIGDSLVSDQVRAAVHDAMTDAHRRFHI